MRNADRTNLGNDSKASWKHVERTSFDKDSNDGRVSMATYVEMRFVPDHVMQKTRAGRTHYQAILKHILRPEVVSTMFARYGLESKSRLTSVDGWPYLDDANVCDLTSDHVRNIVSRAISQGYSPQTVKHIRNVLGTIISRASQEQLFRRANPAWEVSLPPTTHAVPPNLTLVEAKEVLGLMRYPEREIALILITTGLNVSDVCGLRWKHVNLSDTSVCSDGEIIAPRCMLVARLGAAFGHRDRAVHHFRTFEIPGAILQRLKALRREQGQTAPDDFLLPLSAHDKSYSTYVNGLQLKRIGKQLGMPWLSWQTLKRAHQTFMADLRNQLSQELLSVEP